MANIKIVVAGNPIDGFEFFGPYPHDHAFDEDNALHRQLDGDWWITEVQRPLES